MAGGLVHGGEGNALQFPYTNPSHLYGEGPTSEAEHRAQIKGS
jgi:hypothetical protein